jgi:uncharacterized membrane protein
MPPPPPRPGTRLTLPPVREVPLLRPFRWLALGWRDFTRAFLPSVLHGILAAAGGYIILAVVWGQFHLMSGALTGFLLVAPILATGLYDLSRRMARGEAPSLGAVFSAWRISLRPLVWLGLILVVLGTFWMLISVVLIALFVKASITGFESFVRYVVLSQNSNLFEIWVLLGGIFAALVFAATVVSAPLLLDRDVDMLTAILTSFRAVSANPLPMALWATLIMAATFLGMATLLLGLVVALPVIGHASWHAYADVVDAAALPPRH